MSRKKSRCACCDDPATGTDDGGCPTCDDCRGGYTGPYGDFHCSCETGYGKVCQRCERKISWGAIVAGPRGRTRTGGCGCSGREWEEVELGTTWALSYSDGEEEDQP